MENTHVLKTDPEVFQDSWDGDKGFELRFDDRDFQKDDIIFLTETVSTGEEMKNGAELYYTGRIIKTVVLYKLKGYGLKRDGVF